MNPVIYKMKRWMQVCFLVAILNLLSGCATNGRYVLLKEYASTVPAAPDQPLKGITICIKGFNSTSNLISPDPVSKPEQPEKFSYVRFTPEQSKQWDTEFRSMKKQKSKTDCRLIGNLRNGFGMVMSHVYAMNDPSEWLADTLKMDWESLGAKVVDVSQADTADICVSGTIQFCRVDIYMKIWGDLVVDMNLQPKNRETIRKHLHTEGGTVAWVAATSEFYTPIRESRQKLSWLATREVLNVLK